MFSAACKLAQQYTRPFMISVRQHDGNCDCSIGAFVVLNSDGWALTANHIITLIDSFSASRGQYRNILTKRAAIEQDQTIKKHVKMNQLNGLKIPPGIVTHLSVYLGVGSGFEVVHRLPEVDLAVFKIKDFDAGQIAGYPILKNYNSPMDQGTSLCKLGFPFHPIKPQFDTATNAFTLPPGALPAPLFPMEGILTRTVNVVPPNGVAPFPYKFVETSSPGLKGQSGGPTFDVNGHLWAIQSQTRSLRLDFGENMKNSKEAEHAKNQYLNVGWGIHIETITHFLNQKQITFVTSP